MAEAIPSQESECSLATGSDVAFDHLCTPCEVDDDIKEAEGYCSKCNEYLCTACLKCHKNMSATKKHTLLDKNKMPIAQNVTSQPVIDNSTQPCKTHKDEVVKYYCPVHKIFGCSVCMIPDHDNCKEKIYIPNRAKNLTKSKEFKNCQALITELTKTSENINKLSSDNIKLSADYCIKAKQDIEAFRQDINDVLDILKLDIEERLEEIGTVDEAAMNLVETTTNQILSELHRMSSEFKTLVDKKQHSQLFIEMKKAEDKLADLQTQLEEMKVGFISAIQFKPSDELQKLVAKKDALGELLVKRQDEIIATHLADIKIESLGDVDLWWISGAAIMSKDRLVVTEWVKKVVKLIDTEHQQVISEYQTETLPCDVACINNEQIAVTLTNCKKILFMTTKEDQLVLEKEIRVKGSCAFIDYTDEKLIVSFIDRSEIRIMSLTGKVLKTFAKSSSGEPLFSRAPFVTYSPFRNAIYASDRENNRVWMLDMDGNVIAKYIDDALDNPTGITVDDMGMVYVCGNNSNNVHLLTPDCCKVKILLTERDGIMSPWGGCSYCPETKRLYVGMKCSKYAKVFKLV